MKLSECEFNKKYVIKSIKAADKLLKRLAELGIAAGAEITPLKLSPLKSSLLVSVYRYRLSLRSDLAEKIEVE